MLGFLFEAWSTNRGRKCSVQGENPQLPSSSSVISKQIAGIQGRGKITRDLGRKY